MPDIPNVATSANIGSQRLFINLMMFIPLALEVDFDGEIEALDRRQVVVLLPEQTRVDRTVLERLGIHTLVVRPRGEVATLQAHRRRTDARRQPRIGHAVAKRRRANLEEARILRPHAVTSVARVAQRALLGRQRLAVARGERIDRGPAQRWSGAWSGCS